MRKKRIKQLKEMGLWDEDMEMEEAIRKNQNLNEFGANFALIASLMAFLIGIVIYIVIAANMERWYFQEWLMKDKQYESTR